MIEIGPALTRLRGRSTAGRRRGMAKRKTEGTDRAAPGIRERTCEAAAGPPRRREDEGAAAAPVGESEGGMIGEGAEATTGEGGACREKEEGGDRYLMSSNPHQPTSTTTQSCNHHMIINCCPIKIASLWKICAIICSVNR